MTKIFTATISFLFLITTHLYSQTLNGFSSINKLTPLTVANNTADKPQSKVWQYDGKWWTVLNNTEGTHVWMLNQSTWEKVVTISPSTYEKADCKVVGNLVHIFLFRGSNNHYLTSVEYNKSTKTYDLWSKRPGRVTIPLESAAETATIDVDSKGRMWLASDGNNSVNVRWSDSPYTTWSEPITLSNEVKEDDICAVVALPGKVGVFWSNQGAQRFGFKTHTDGDSPTTWSSDEVPASQSAQQIGMGMADDHLNMATAVDGTLYCAIKTSYDRQGSTRLGLLVRRPNGNWDNMYPVTSDAGTRPIVILNEELGVVRVIYTEGEQGGNILYKESPTSTISFCKSHALFTGHYNYPSSLKSSYSSEVVIIATDESVKPPKVVGALAKDNLTSPVNTPLSCEQSNPAQTITVYPNPFSDAATIRFFLNFSEEYNITIMDSKGMKILSNISGSGKGQQGKFNEIDLKGLGLSGGLYMLILETGGRKYSTKIVHFHP